MFHKYQDRSGNKSQDKGQDDGQNKKQADETGPQQKEICDSRCRK